jgi:tyrosyl-tRNA synthetase
MGIEEQVVVMMPLLEGTDGINKMSKSFGNYIGITESPKDMFGKMMSISDELMLRYYELLSRISIDELEALKEGIKNGSLHPKKVKENLALEIVERYHGKDTSLKAKEEFEHVFRDKGMPDEIPVFKPMGKGKANVHWLPEIIKDSGLAKSTSEAIRLIKQGGVSINGERWDDPDKKLSLHEECLLKVGKRKFLKIVPGK